MTTDEFIARLVSEPAQPPLRPVRLALMILAAIALPVAVFLGLEGPRPGLPQAWTNPMVPLKTILPLISCGLSLTLLLRLARPEARTGITAFGYAIPLLTALALWLGTFALRAPANRFAEVGFGSLAECLGIILALAALPTIVALRLVRQGASSSPMLSGALAGLTASTGAATGYSLFCTRDNPLFFVTWYGASILIVTLIAAWLGRRMLAW